MERDQDASRAEITSSVLSLIPHVTAASQSTPGEYQVQEAISFHSGHRRNSAFPSWKTRTDPPSGEMPYKLVRKGTSRVVASILLPLRVNTTNRL